MRGEQVEKVDGGREGEKMCWKRIFSRKEWRDGRGRENVGEKE